MVKFTLLLLFLINLHNVFAFNILAIVSMPLGSHYMAFQTLFRELANRGHSVTVINNYPDKDPVKNLSFINLNQNLPTNGTSSLDFYDSLKPWYLHWYNLYRHLITDSIKTDCDAYFSNTDLKMHLASGPKYDVIFVEQFISDCGLVYAATMYDAPIIGITSHVLLPWAYPRLGIPFDSSVDAYYFSNAGTNPSVFEKIEIIVMDAILQTIGRWYLQRYIYDSFKTYRPDLEFDVEEIAKDRMKMVFANQHFSLTGARLMAPQLFEMAGIHIGTPKPLAPHIEKFLSTADHGVIYFSLGSNLKSSTMRKEKLQHFLSAFKKIPQKVLWKFENGTLGHDSEDIFAASWLPQLDILCHPKVIGFISHGGMLSLSEAIHCGTPVLVMPFFGDQFSNAAVAESSGLGVKMFFQDITAEKLVAAIERITSTQMQVNGIRISQLWHDRPTSVLDSAIYWTEYVARHRTSPPSLPSKRSTWFEKTKLDVTAVLISLFCVIFVIICGFLKILRYILVKLMRKTVCTSNTKKETKKKVKTK